MKATPRPWAWLAVRPRSQSVRGRAAAQCAVLLGGRIYYIDTLKHTDVLF